MIGSSDNNGGVVVGGLVYGLQMALFSGSDQPKIEVQLQCL